MDPNLISAQPTGLYGWILTNASMIAFIAQLVYWLGMLVILFYAVWQYKRWVNFQLGTGRSGKLRDGEETAESAASAEDINVEEFVE